MEVLNVKVKKETKEKLERFAKARGYKNKSEALRKIIEDHFEEHPEFFATDKLAGIFELAEKISNKEFDRMAARIFKGRESAAELVGEGRER